MRVLPSYVVGFIDAFYPKAASNQLDDLPADQRPHFEVLLDLLDRVPTELMALLSPTDQSQFLIAVAVTRAHLVTWRSQTILFGKYKGLGNEHPFVVIRRILAKCPDQAPALTTNALGFINDPQLRDVLRQDVSSAHRALNEGEWKSATVLAGSVIEALLLWAIDKRLPSEVNQAITTLVNSKALLSRPDTKNGRPRAPDKWDLVELVAVATELKILKSDTTTAVSLARNFRNLIHPGRAKRLQISCNQATALTALGALEHTIVDLS